MAAAGSQGEIRKLRKKLRQIENLERLERDLTQEEREKVKKNSTISLSPRCTYIRLPRHSFNLHGHL
jgi:hypothetical protein